MAAQNAAYRTQHLQVFAKPAYLVAHDPRQYLNYGAFADFSFMREGQTRVNRQIDEFPWQLGVLYPQTNTITLNHMDGKRSWNSSDNLDYMLNTKHWENVFGGSRMLKMELEITEKNKETLTPIVETLLAFTFDIGNGEELVAEQEVQERTWAKLYGRFQPCKHANHHHGIKSGNSALPLAYTFITYLVLNSYAKVYFTIVMDMLLFSCNSENIGDQLFLKIKASEFVFKK